MSQLASQNALPNYCSSAIAVGSKFVILEIINTVFGDRVSFTDPWHGAFAFIVLIAAIMAAELVVIRIYRYWQRPTVVN
jgi:hypothetical protein